MSFPSSNAISRRNFLKASGLAAGTLLVSGCTVNLQQPVWMESYNRAPEFTLPGEDLWFASTCRMCPAGCGTITRVSNGRARKIEGNPKHPLNHGKLCARGQAGLQELYHPDRIRQIMQRTGERGQGQWATTDWVRLIDELAAQVGSADPSRIAFVTGNLPDYQHTLIARFLDGLGAPDAIRYDVQSTFDGRNIFTQVNEELFGEATMPIFDIANADVLYGFGTNFLESWLSPVSYAQAFGAMRGRPGNRGVFVAFEPRMSMTAANSDRWLPAAVGTEGLIALALGKIIVDEGLRPGSEAYRALYNDVEVTAIAQAADISTADLTYLARVFGDARRPLAMPGGLLAGYSNGLDNVKAVMMLNLLTQQIGTRGGIHLSPPAPSRDLRQSPLNRYRDVEQLVRQMNAGEIDLLFVLGVNPIYSFPQSLGFTEALVNVRQVVTFATLLDETAALADLVLPSHTYLETWGYQLVNPSGHQLTVSAQQPVVRPLYDSRDPADVFMALADKIGGNVAQRIPWPNLVNFIQSRLTSLQLLEGNTDAANPELFWASWLQQGGWWSKDALWTIPEPVEAVGTSLTPTFPDSSTTDGEYPFALIPIPSIAFGDGRHAGLPWLQELSDPMTTSSWHTWVEINPTTAAKLDLQTHDVVLIESSVGTIEASVYVYPGIRPDVVAVPVGQGHTELGRYGRNWGANVMQLLAGLSDPKTGELAWAGTRVKLRKTADQHIIPLLESNVGVDRFRRTTAE